MGINKVQDMFEKYKILGTIKEAAKYFNISPEYLRKNFIKYNFPYTKKKIYTYNENYFNIDTEGSFYWAGFIAADGNVTKKADFTLSLQLEDKSHIEKFAKDTNSNAKIIIDVSKNTIINNIKTKNYGSAIIRFRAKSWMSSFQRFNIIPNKTKTYSIPKNIINNEIFKHFIRGYFEGDGWFSVRGNKKLGFGLCGNLSVMKAIQNHLQKECDIEKLPLIYKQKNIFRFEFNNQYDVYKISSYLYKDATIYLDRKYELSKLAKEFSDNTVILNLDKDKLIEAYNRLKSYKLMAKEFNCSSNSIANYMKKYNLKRLQCHF